MIKSPLDIDQISENVSMIEFDIVYCDNIGRIMDELAPFIEKRTVVFISLDDKRRFRISDFGAARKIFRHAADEKPGIDIIFLKKKCNQSCRGRFSMSSRDYDALSFSQESLVNQGRKRCKRDFLFRKQPFELGISPHCAVSDHNEIRREFCEPVRIETFENFDSVLL